MKNHFVYLDHASTTPVYPEVLDAMLPYFAGEYGNASSSSHAMGWVAKEAIETARKSVAGLVGAKPNEIFFTSGATESINWALKNFFSLFGSVIVTQPTEHMAVLNSLSWLQTRAARVSSLPLDTHGRILARDIAGIIGQEPNALLAVMSANNETGVIQPLTEISALRREKHCWFFCDASQSAGKQDLDVEELSCDLLAFSAHKMGGPKGAGALFIREKLQDAGFESFIHGGSQQSGLRGGTLNVPAIVGFGKACELASKFDSAKIARLRYQLEAGLKTIFDAAIIGENADRVAHISAAVLPGISSDELLSKINHRLAVSTGAACNSIKTEPSHVLKAIGFSDQEAYSALRFSLGYGTTEEDIIQALELLKSAL